jgi:hypothetical protein
MGQRNTYLAIPDPKKGEGVLDDEFVAQSSDPVF